MDFKGFPMVFNCFDMVLMDFLWTPYIYLYIYLYFILILILIYLYAGFAFARRLAGAEFTLEPCFLGEIQRVDRFPEPCQTEIPRASGSAGAAPALRASAYRPRGAAGPWNLCLARLWESINPLDFSQKAGLQGEFRACKATSSAQPEDFLI